MFARYTQVWGLLLFILCFEVPSGLAQPEQYNPSAKVTHADGSWQIAGKHRTVTLREADFKIALTSGSVHWDFLAAADNDLTLNVQGKNVQFKLTDARKREISSYQTGYQAGLLIQLSQFQHQGKNLDLALQLFVCLEGSDEDLVCEVIAKEGSAVIKECLWPKGLEPESSDHTVVPFMQGMLLPKNWPRKVWLYNSETYGRGLYMPWWGHQQGEAAMLVLLETPYDGGCVFSHPESGPTRMELKWMHSLGKLAYPRRARLCFFDHGNYVDLAKRYRRHVIETGHLVSLKEKIARNPLVGRLIGAPVIHTSILYHIQPASSYYDKTDPAKNHQIVSFADRAAQLKAVAEKGIQRAYVHLDGWGYRGYDNLHPDILPPCLEAGGWQGMQRFADVCDSLGYIFAVHDQYRDYYHDAASYDPRHTIITEKGDRPFGHTWYGGEQSILCSQLAPGYVARNHHEILAHGVKLRGAYLDVFAVVPPDECYNPEHPVTRQACLEYRAHSFNIVRAYGGVISSEEPADWTVPYLDLVHHGPFALDPNPGKGPAMGIPVPLFSLVYHDAIILPWSRGKGEWGIPETDLGYLHGLANAGMPYMSLNPDETELQQVRTMCALHERIGLSEMIKHEFLDANYRRQRTTFADGTTVTIDLEAETAKIDPPLAQ